MIDIISIYEARTNLSKYIKAAQKGAIIYVGAYGHAQAVIAPIPTKISVEIGLWAHKKQLGAYDYDELTGSPELIRPLSDKNFNKES